MFVLWEAYVQVSTLVKEHRMLPPSCIDQYRMTTRDDCWHPSCTPCRHDVLDKLHLPEMELGDVCFYLKNVILELHLG